MSTNWPPPYPKCQKCKSTDGRDVYLVPPSIRTDDDFQVKCDPCFGVRGVPEGARLMGRNPKQ